MKTRSPLRYPGGKSRAVSKIVDKYIIPNIPESKKVCSPFFGGGSIEIDLAKRGFRVYGYDAFLPLVDFWQVLLKNPNKLANATEKKLRVSRKKFEQIQENLLQPHLIGVNRRDVIRNRVRHFDPGLLTAFAFVYRSIRLRDVPTPPYCRT